MREYAIEYCEKLSERFCVSCGKDSKNITNNLIIKASKGIFTTVNASLYSNASQYSGTMKALRNLSPQ